MPLLIRTPEEILRATRKDLYFIRDMGMDAGWNAKGVKMILHWIRKNLPETPIERIGPSEYSGYIVGGCFDTWVDFSPEGLQAFMERWETPDGKSIDERFQCFLYPFNEWREKHGSFVPTRDKPKGIGTTVWWYTPQGFVHHQLSPAEARKHDGFHPALPNDIWFHVPDLWPELAGLDTQKLTSGSIIRYGAKKPWRVTYREPLLTEGAVTPSVGEIREWFGLAGDVEVREDDV